MAKAKKKMITIEEVLVPVEEQPYEVPENWCWTTVSSVSEVIMGQSPSGESTTDDSSFTPLIGGAADMGDLLPKASRYTKSPTKISKAGDVIICIRATLGRPVFSDGEYCLGRGVAGIRSDIISKEFLRYFYLNNEQYLYDNATGTTFAQVTAKVLEKMCFPLPPLQEQQRIVEQIESLFSKLDEAKEKTESVVEAYETNCASILKMAFRGELSKEWRNTNNLDMDSWRIRSFDECILKMQNGLAKRSGEEGELFGVLRLANLGEDDISTDDLREIRLTEKEQNAYKLNFNDVVMIRVNGSRENVGRQLLIRGDNNWAFCDHIIRIRFVEDIIPEYMIMFSKTDEYRNYIETHMVSSAGQNTISRKGLSELSISVPSYEEQKVIIDTVNSMMEKEKAAKAIMESVLSEIDMMKKSVLAKAFRGELGTNDPLEESSEILLKQIMEV